MLINLRNALMSGKRLPYDAEVEYLQSSGTQYINTGIKPGPNTRVEAVFAMTTFTANCGLFGARGNATADNNSYNLFIISNNGSRVRWDWSGSGQYQTSEAETSTDATYVLGAAGVNITRNGATVMSVSASKAAINYPLYVFNFNNVGTPYSTGANARFWSVKIYDGQTLVFDAIPVRKGTVGYLYDRVSGALFGNAGTGDFVLGQDVVPVEYLQSDGGQYIQTDFTPDDSYGFEVDCFTPVASSSYNSRAIGLQNGQVRWLYCTERRALSSSFFGWNEAVSVGSQPDKRIVARCNWLNNRTISIGDTVYKSNLATLDSVGGLKAVLFGINNGGSVLTSQLFVGKMYSAKVSVGNAIGYNYAPIRVGTEGAMMDVLTRRIYRNAGTGAFTYGNDLKYPIPAA